MGKATSQIKIETPQEQKHASIELKPSSKLSEIRMIRAHVDKMKYQQYQDDPKSALERLELEHKIQLARFDESKNMVEASRLKLEIAKLMPTDVAIAEAIASAANANVELAKLNPIHIANEERRIKQREVDSRNEARRLKIKSRKLKLLEEQEKKVKKEEKVFDYETFKKFIECGIFVFDRNNYMPKDEFIALFKIFCDKEKLQFPSDPFGDRIVKQKAKKVWPIDQEGFFKKKKLNEYLLFLTPKPDAYKKLYTPENEN